MIYQKQNDMTLTNLTENRERIMKAIAGQFSCPVDRNAHVKAVMAKMVKWLELRKDIQDMKATKANIDKFTSMATASYIKNDYKTDSPAVKAFFDAHFEAKKIEMKNNL